MMSAAYYGSPIISVGITSEKLVFSTVQVLVLG